MKIGVANKNKALMELKKRKEKTKSLSEKFLVCSANDVEGIVKLSIVIPRAIAKKY